jgi:hypothetical protein
MCIYLGDKIGLNYTGREHIFPAGIGGIAKLPAGFVSDEFNEMISALELDFMRNSLVSIPRHFEGPGKRGKLAEKFHSPSKVSVLLNVKENVHALGYTIKGKPYEIPHISLNTVTGETSLNFANDPSAGHESKISEFHQWSEQIEWDKTIELDGNMLPENLILYGITKLESGKLRSFIARNNLTQFQLNLAMVQRIAEGYVTQSHEPSAVKYHAQVHAKATLSEDHYRIYAKVAINFIASIKGLDFVQADRFKPVVNWVAYGGHNEFARLIPELNLFGTDALKFPPSSHYVIVSKVQKRMIAYISLYSSLTVLLDFGFEMTEPFHECGMVCDWKNRREYSLLEYISTLVINPNIPA